MYSGDRVDPELRIPPVVSLLILTAASNSEATARSAYRAVMLISFGRTLSQRKALPRTQQTDREVKKASETLCKTLQYVVSLTHGAINHSNVLGISR